VTKANIHSIRKFLSSRFFFAIETVFAFPASHAWWIFYVRLATGSITTYVTFQLPVKPFIPTLCDILPQVGTIKSGILEHFAFIA
jgi:hypothetical protein